jgi:hypothetical protein
LGVVFEVSMPRGLDVLAGYADHSARYFNFSGAAVIWERPDTSLDALIDSFLATGTPIVARAGPSNTERLPPPPSGQARYSFLTPGGVHFGQRPMGEFDNDPLAGPVMQSALQLMQALSRTRTPQK